MKHLSSGLLVAGAVMPNAATAQLTYRAGPDTVRYESVNEYRMYFVSGADTLGQPIGSRTLEHHVLRQNGNQLRLAVVLEGIDSPFHVETIFEITRAGQVVRVGDWTIADVPNADPPCTPSRIRSDECFIGR